MTQSTSVESYDGPGDGAHGSVAEATRSWTSPSTLRLATPWAVSEGLRHIGIRWNPVPVSEADEPHTSSGLYIWVDRLGIDTHAVPPAECGSLYIGVGNSSKGVLDRLKSEESWAVEEFIHAHGLAVRRRESVAVWGPVKFDPSVSLLWLTHHTGSKDVDARAWLSDAVETNLLRAAEKIAVRLSIHIGDTVSPVNSHYAGAWNTSSDADWIAYLVAERMGATY